MTSSALLTHPTETIAVPVIDPSSLAVPRRGGDVRVFDRRDMREVGGPGHPFAAPSDLLATNGLIRFWVGSRGEVPYLNVSAYTGGVWRSVGCLMLAEPGSSSTLVAARLTSATPEKTTVALSVRNAGTILLRLHRGERMIHITHGTNRRPTANVSRSVTWTGTPPAAFLYGASVVPAAFANGLSLAGSGIATFPLPLAALGRTSPVSLWWKPIAASTSLADAGLGRITDAAGSIWGDVQWFAVDKTLRWTQGATVLSSAPLTFAAGTAVAIQLRPDTTGRTLTSKVGADAVAHVRDSLVNTLIPASITLGQIGAAVVGDTLASTALGAGPLGYAITGASTSARGPVDNVMVFADALSDTEATTLAGAGSALAGLPRPESRLVWYAPFDVSPSTPGAPLQPNGSTYETTADGGSTPSYYQGLTRSLFSRSVASKDSGLSLSRTAVSWPVIASVSTTAAGDTNTDMLNQAAAANSQEVTVR